MICRLGEFTLDTDRAELTGAVALEPKAYDLLLLLLRHGTRVVTKEQAVEAMWRGRIVSDSAISTVVKSLRRALGDSGESQRLIRTVRGRGYRLAAEVPLPPAGPAQPSSRDEVGTAMEHEQALAGSKPRLAILPFRRLGWSGELNVVADAVPPTDRGLVSAALAPGRRSGVHLSLQGPRPRP
jgi:DNA-binding winged helix-turn-helix (wHTH) protein